MVALYTSDIAWLNADSRTFLERDYLLPGQTPEGRIHQIAQKAEMILGIEGFAAKFESYMHKGWISLSSPIWANFGIERGLPISCNGSYISDSLDSILTKTAEIGIMSKYGAGTSAYFGDIRPRGSAISTGGRSNGAVHFMELLETTTSVISQSNVRRGSCAVYLPIEHGDIGEFLNVRSEGNAIQQLSVGVTITDAWMQSMVDGDMDKRRLWARVIQKRFETGYPYIIFIDNVNNAAPQVYKDRGLKITHSNLCVAPETLILTRAGHQIISELEDETVDIWNGKEWSSTTVQKTGENQKLVKVILSDGKVIECTPYHKWYTVDSYTDQSQGKSTEKRTHELKVGDKLIEFDVPVIDGTDEFKYPYTHGAFCGDGTYESNMKPRLTLYSEKDQALPYLDYRTEPVRDSLGRLNVRLPLDLNPKFDVPLTSSVETKLRWLEGYFDMDGTIARNGTNESIQAGSVEPVFIRNVQLLLQTLGVQSKIVDEHEERDALLPDGHGGYAMYHCQKVERLLVSSIGLYQLAYLGFSPKRLKFDNRLPQREAAHFVKVVEVIDEGRYADTYCVTEPLEHKAVFNGILTGQCSEIALYDDENQSFVCDLSSLNVLYFDDWQSTDVVETLTYFLDAVMSEYIEKVENIPYMRPAYNFAVNQRALGIGVLGWHSYLQSRMIAFESTMAKLLNTKIQKVIQTRSHEASRAMAERYGEPALLTGYGLRNVTTTAIAPTTSSSFILGQVSPSIEPENSNYYVKDLAKGKFTHKNPYLVELLDKKGQNDATTWKSILMRGGSVQHLPFLDDHERDVFKTFGEISQLEIVIQASGRQRFLDQSQSLNLMIHPDTPLRDVNTLMIQAWELKLKSFYYQRSTNPAQELGRNLLACSSCES